MKCGLIWFCSIRYSRSCFCFSSSRRCSISAVTPADMLLMPRPMSPSSLSHSISGSAEKSPPLIFSMRLCSAEIGWAIIRCSRNASEQPSSRMAVRLMRSGTDTKVICRCVGPLGSTSIRYSSWMPMGYRTTSCALLPDPRV